MYISYRAGNAIANSLTNCKVMACAHVELRNRKQLAMGQELMIHLWLGCFITLIALTYMDSQKLQCCYYDKSFYLSAVDGSESSVPNNILFEGFFRFKSKYDAVASKELKASLPFINNPNMGLFLERL